MITNEGFQKKLLEKVLSSSEFSTSKIHASYLSYLYEGSRHGEHLKETKIAIEFFGKDASFNPAEDTVVRVHTYTLRKKLENYYLNEGRDDKYRFVIPKGHYLVTLVPVESPPHRLLYLLRKKYSVLICGALACLLIVVGIRYLVLQRQLARYQVVEKTDPIWADFLHPRLPVLLVLGDHFFFDEYSPKYGASLTIRYGKINSAEDLEALAKRFPDQVIKPTEEPYFPYHSIWSLPPILSILYSVHQKPILRKASALSPQNLNENNIIYLGSIKTLYALKHTIKESHFDYSILPHQIVYTPSDSSARQVYQTSLHSAGQNEDLVLVLKLPGPVDNAILLIASYHSLGAPEIANHLTYAPTRAAVEEKFINKYKMMPRYFEILFRVTGIDKTAYRTDILVFNKIEKK